MRKPGQSSTLERLRDWWEQVRDAIEFAVAPAPQPVPVPVRTRPPGR